MALDTTIVLDSATTDVNNPVTIPLNVDPTPAQSVSFGNGLVAQFATSNDTSTSSTPLTFTFGQPLASFLLLIYGETGAGGIQVFNSAGSLLKNYPSGVLTGTVTVAPAGISSTLNGKSVRTISINESDFNSGVASLSGNGNDISKVVLTPINNDFVGYSLDQTVINAPIPPVVTTPPTVTPPPPPAPTPTIPQPIIVTTATSGPAPDLSTLVTLSVPGIQTTYTKGTLKASDPQTVTVTNKSSQVTVQVTITGLKGVTFTPSTFSLTPTSSQDVITSFDAVQEEQLPEGTNTITAVLNLSSTTAVS